jgi:hypothetical protein
LSSHRICFDLNFFKRRSLSPRTLSPNEVYRPNNSLAF